MIRLPRRNTVIPFILFLAVAVPILSSCLERIPDNLFAAGSIPENLSRLAAAYPEHIRAGGVNAVRWSDGEMMVFDDGIAGKSFDALLNRPDLEDQMSMPYPEGDRYEITANADPGRVRLQPFFLKMYGRSHEEVKARLVPVVWLPKTVGKTLLVTSVNGVDKKLKAVSDELDELPDKIKKCVSNPAGTFAWRTIAGTDRLSAHSFGIAIDIDLACSNYWRWDADAEDKMRRCEVPNRIPMEIVLIFERHGFIWGGKWYHYDTMHFEYRPELLAATSSFETKGNR